MGKEVRISSFRGMVNAEINEITEKLSKLHNELVDDAQGPKGSGNA
jgi:hypothetical protein